MFNHCFERQSANVNSSTSNKFVFERPYPNTNEEGPGGRLSEDVLANTPVAQGEAVQAVPPRAEVLHSAGRVRLSCARDLGHDRLDLPLSGRDALSTHHVHPQPPHNLLPRARSKPYQLVGLDPTKPRIFALLVVWPAGLTVLLLWLLLL